MTNHAEKRRLGEDELTGLHNDQSDASVRWALGRDLVVGDIITDPNAGHFTITRITPDPEFGPNAICVRTRRGRDGKELEATMLTSSKLMLHADSPIR